MPFQDKPFLQLTVASKDVFILNEFTGSEALSQLFRYDLTAYSENKNIAAADLLLKPATIQINTDSDTYYFNGIVSRFRAGESDEKFRHYSIEIMPALWQLGFSADCRIFQKKKVTEIVQTLCQPLGILINLEGLKNSYEPREYCVQYRETTLNFIQRLLQEEGIFYFFKHEKDKHTLMLADKTTAFKPCSEPQLNYRNDGHYRGHYINYWSRQYNLYSGSCAYTDYNFETPDASLFAKQSATPQLKAVDQLQLFDYPGSYSKISEGKKLADLHFEALEATHQLIESGSNYPDLRPGSTFTLQHPGCESESGDYYVTAVNHSAYDRTQQTPINKDSQETHYYANHFMALPKTVKYRSPHYLAKPVISGHQTAKVTGDGQRGQEVNVDQYGRINVCFHWDREQQNSCRIRVAQSWAGQNWGTVFHPRIGQEVVVQFENGDPDRPMVVGSVYNADQMPPYALNDNDTQSGIKTHSSKNGAASDANELRFEDRMGQEEIYLHAQKDHTRVIENNETVNINQGDQITKIAAGSSTLEAAQAIELKVGSNQITINTQGVYINGQKIKLNKPT